MAVRLEAWNGRRNPEGSVQLYSDRHNLSLQERVARIQRRRRASKAQAAIESAIWIAGSAVVAVIALGGFLGLR